MFRVISGALFTASFLFGQRIPIANLKALYDAQKWAELHDELKKTKGDHLYRGAVAVVFHQNPRQAESLLGSVIKAAPKSDEAYQAYEWLSHLFLYAGQYKHLVSTMEARWSAFPGREGQEQEKDEIAGFRGLPDQVTVSVHPSTVQHADKSIFISLSINGSPATYFFDTGAWLNSMSESEAKRLGLRLSDATGSAATMTRRTGFRTAVADEVKIGG